MPMFMCPNCNVSMSQLKRSEIEVDMCPQCRGVWLDRGELEKLLDNERGVIDGARRGYGDESRQPFEQSSSRHGDDHDRSGHDKHGGSRRDRRGFNLFDIFD